MRIRIYSGQYYDEETGLHYNWHRYYDPKTGRYLTPDPIRLAGGINLYAYAGNNPTNLTDPLGLGPKGILEAAAKVVELGIRGFKRIGPKLDYRDAKRYVEEGGDILARSRKTGGQMARELGGGKKPIYEIHGPKREGYRHHYHPADRSGGHIFVGTLLGIIGSFLDPFDSIAGELANSDDTNENGIPDWEENIYPDWQNQSKEDCP